MIKKKKEWHTEYEEISEEMQPRSSLGYVILYELPQK